VLVTVNVSEARRKLSVEERAKRFVNGRYIYCGGFNHRLADCAAMKTAEIVITAAEDVKTEDR